jgi:glycosyltransferase involved in cell wall biosynthesis
MKKRHVVIALPAVRDRTIGAHAITRAKILAEHYHVTIISDSFPDAVPVEVKFQQVFPSNFDYLRRFCHVPNEWAFASSVRAKLVQLQARQPIDFLLCHGYTLTKYVGRHLCKRYGVRYGMFMHGHIFTRPRGSYDWRLTAFYRLIAPVCYKEAHLIFALSPSQRDLAIRAGAAAHRVVLAPNGIRRQDIEIVCGDNDTVGIPEVVPSRLRILYVGRLSVEKGVDTLLAACKILTEWETEYSLTLVGDGPSREELSDLAQHAGIANCVNFVGSVNREHVGAHYRVADVLCVPSLDEPFGNVVLEGLVGGCVVVGSEVGGIRFIITDGVDGYLVPPEKPQKWAEKLRFVSENRNQLDGLVRNGQEMVDRRFGWESIVHGMHEAISRTLVQE